MKYQLQELNIPKVYTLIKNDFSTYDPVVDFDKDDHLFYLWEDLLQIINKDITIDLGWYDGSNNGEFRLFVIKDSNWDNPILKEVSKSQKIITEKLNNILKQFEKI